MYAFGEDSGVAYYICANDKEEAIMIYKTNFGEEAWNEATEEYEDPNDFVREMDKDEIFIYYHDGFTPEEDKISNLINKYCTKPDIFACSEF